MVISYIHIIHIIYLYDELDDTDLFCLVVLEMSETGGPGSVWG